MLEEYKSQTVVLLLGGLYGFDVDSFEFNDDSISGLMKNGVRISIDILRINTSLNGFVFNPQWFADDENKIVLIDFPDGYYLVNKRKVKKYLVAFKKNIKRIEKDICQLDEKFMPEDTSYMVVRKRKMTENEKKDYERDSEEGD